MNNKFLYLALSSVVLMSACFSSDDSDDSYSIGESVADFYYSECSYSSDVENEQVTSDNFSDFVENSFISTAENATSTFSVDADGAAYGIMRKYTSNGWSVPKSSVRIEEYLNYFTFDYAEPSDDNSVAINSELGTCPWNEEHKLLRLGIKGKTLAESEIPLANYVFLIDVSGSMNETDKIYLLKSCLLKMLTYMNPKDKVSIVTYAGESRLVLESTEVSDISKIQNAINSLSTGGSTDGGSAIKMAYQQALNNYNKDKNNRIILGTDGDFNVGITSTDSLVSLVESYASKGIYLTACGFGSGNLNDAMMEKISNYGNGTYEYIDCEDEMMKVFVHERGKFTSVANDSKCQITFDTNYVSSYRLIGYENRVMNNEDFEDDTKDAGEIGSGQTITALYEIVTTDKFDVSSSAYPIASFDFRYKKSLLGESIPLSLEILNTDLDNNLSENFTFAAGVAAFGLSVRNSEYKGTADFNLASDLISKSLSFDPNGYRASFLELINSVKIAE